jgi:hypothetical protein
MEGSCRAYWRCEGFKSQPACCPKGERYVQGHGCTRDEACDDFCGHIHVLEGKGEGHVTNMETKISLIKPLLPNNPKLNIIIWKFG